ncbi:probable UDP-sugar transporter protein SLC35A4 isoform X2 [Xenia sp. Carnegie-2017]|uniref:probable UDP-sugar transporter protein SLC35A4 isoform X2 n=1 Tax=Xenia sp. Carnegie-2017 TaxID=2897299 RepID=UPI001F046A64|nr:probable UDP-sugar transporter protein SLC35A4 isoform X2 [Xenia sp. Carnegie-2017]
MKNSKGSRNWSNLKISTSQLSEFQEITPFPRLLWYTILVLEVFIYGSYPLSVKLSKIDNKIKYNTTSVVMFIELGKFVFSFINLYPLWKRGELKRQPLIVWISFSVPAILYCFNNNVSILVQQYLDPASYVIMSNLKIPITAFLYRLIIMRRLSFRKWFAIFLLTAAGTLNSLGNLVSEEKLHDHINDVHVTLTGLFIMLVSCVVSGLAGIWTEVMVKRQYDLSLHQQNVMLYFFGVLLNIVGFLIVDSPSFSTGNENLSHKINNIFHHYNPWVKVIICSEICCGLIVSIVMKHASNITKLFITSSSILVTTLFAFLLFKFELNVFLIIAVVLIIFALCLYNH